MDAKLRTNLPAEQAPVGVPEILIDTFADANTAVVICDSDGGALYRNGEMYALAQALGRTINQLTDLAPQDRTSAASIDFERFRAGRFTTLRSRYVIARADGTDLWVDLSVRRLAVASDAAPIIVVQIVDITAEREAKRNEVRLETALEAGRQGVWEYDARRENATYSRMWRRLRGMADDETVDGQTESWMSRVHPDDREIALTGARNQGVGTDGFDTFEYRERHRDGHYVWILSRGKPIEWDEHGNSLRMIGTDTDITPLKTIEAELAIEKERLQVTLQSIADGVIATDQHGDIIFMNAAAEQMTGWVSADALGQNMESVFDSRLEAEPDRASGLMQQCLNRGTVVKANEYTLLKGKDDRSRYIREVASPVLGKDGKINGAVMVFRDSTQRRKLMRKLEYNASHDSLTDLDNRASFEEELEASVTSARTGQSAHALCLIDLDHFKEVNDSVGHSAGDALLKEIAQLLRAACRKGDHVARLGGDEFAIIFKDCSLKKARSIANSILSKVAEMRFTWQGETFQISASIGVTSIEAGGKGAMSFYRYADNACYSAKRNGRGCVVVYG